MAEITYPWNPFQDQILCRVEREVIKTSNNNDRRVLVPRAGPFFGKNVIITKEGSSTPLTPGADYLFAHTFDRFINDYKRNVFGAIVLRKPYLNDKLYMSYDTLGGPFVLDEATFAQLVVNIVNAPRTADWSDLVGIPDEWPSDPHDHPLVQTYDWLENYQALKSLILVMGDAETDGANIKSLLEDHLNKRITEAHPGDKNDLGLPDVANLRPSTIVDLEGNSANVGVTMDVLKEAFRRAGLGTLKL